MKYKATCSFTLILYLSLWYMNAQTNRNITVKIGGLYVKETPYQRATEKIKVDEAELSMMYQFKHGLVKNKNISLVTDTMVLIEKM